MMAPPWMRVSERWSQRSLRSLRMVWAETSKRLARSSTITRPKARAMLRISVWRWDNPAITAPRDKYALMLRLIFRQVNVAVQRRRQQMVEKPILVKTAHCARKDHEIGCRARRSV